MNKIVQVEREEISFLAYRVFGSAHTKVAGGRCGSGDGYPLVPLLPSLSTRSPRCLTPTRDKLLYTTGRSRSRWGASSTAWHSLGF